MQETPPYDGSYDGVTDVDVHTLLSLRLLEEFDTGTISNQDLKEPAACLPAQAQQMGENILLLLRGYRGLLPANFIGRMLMATINLDLLTYTLRLMTNVTALCRTGRMPVEGSIVPEVYLDVTGNRTGQSDSLARVCVERDLEGTGRFFDHNLRLFTLDRMRELSATLQDLVQANDNDPVGEYLEALLQVEQSEAVRVRAEVELAAILQESQAEVSTDAERHQIKKN